MSQILKQSQLFLSLARNHERAGRVTAARIAREMSREYLFRHELLLNTKADFEKDIAAAKLEGNFIKAQAIEANMIDILIHLAKGA